MGEINFGAYGQSGRIRSGARPSRPTSLPDARGGRVWHQRAGTVATGRIERGKIVSGEKIEIVGFGKTQESVVTGVEMFHKTLEEGLPGDAVGILLRGVEREEIQRGAVLAKPKSITPNTKAQAQVYILTQKEGGRHTLSSPDTSRNLLH